MGTKNIERRLISKRALIIFLVLAAFGLGIGYCLKRLSENPPPESVPRPNHANSSGSPVLPQSETSESELSPIEITDIPKMPAVIHATSRPTVTSLTGSTGATPLRIKAEPTPYTQQLVASLTNVNSSGGEISVERAEQWRQTLQTLVAQGTSAVPAIREFLERNEELNFTALNGGDLLGQTSLRGALIDALAAIGGQDANNALLQTLQTTTLPGEIAQLAATLEQQAPGQYRQEIFTSIQEVLAMATKGELAGFDMAPVFQLLQKYGDTGIALLEQTQGAWKYYATLALAGMQDGAGVAALIRQVQTGPNPPGDFALEMLAQTAAQYPEAGAALLEAAQRNRIPESTWRRIISALAGEQYSLGGPPAGANGATIPGLKSYHIAAGNQNFYSVPLAGDLRVRERMQLIEQLASATTSPEIVKALQDAKQTLARE